MSFDLRRTNRELADGRQIIYFDSPDAPERTAVDTRDLGAQAAAGQLRYDALVDDWVAMAAARHNRTFQPPRDECPLCPTGRGTVPSEIPEHDYQVVAFENRFPSYAAQADTSPGPADPLLAQRPAHGRCEVVCFTSDHDASFGQLTQPQARQVVEAWADRTAELNALPEVQQVFAFQNRGEQIGVTLHHPHGQIYAYPYVPARSQDILDAATAHHERTGRLLGADLLHAERDSGDRMVIEGQHWSAYVPFAARWPVEVHLAPHRDVPDLVALDDAERDELAEVYLELMRRLDRYYTGPDGAAIDLPYISGWHQAPAKTGRDVSRLHLQVMSVLRSPDRLKYLAGSESGVTGWVNDVLPERIAGRLREVASA